MQVESGFEQIEKQFEIFDKAIQKQSEALEMAIEFILRSIVNYIKDNGPWTDRTANLRNSIGCNIDKLKSIPAGGSISQADIREFEKPVVEIKGDDYTGVVYAGMEYAIHVELKSGFWVIRGALDKFEPLIEKYFKEYLTVEKLTDDDLVKRFLEGAE